MASGWREVRPADDAWRPAKAMTAAQRAAEQDLAAGGRDYRYVGIMSDRLVLASVCLRLPKNSRRIYAYLRWSEGRKTKEKYICQVTQQSRKANLAEAWHRVREIAKSSGAEVRARNKSWASSPSAASVMRGNRSRDTQPELALRSAVHSLGLRYRVGIRPVPVVRRTADLVFAGQKIAVFLDGCFWHGCPDHHRPATRNRDFWSTKVAANRARDEDTDKLLAAAGWSVVRVWEHEHPEDAARRVAATVRSRRPET